MQESFANAGEAVEKAKVIVREILAILSQNGIQEWRDFLQQRLSEMTDWYSTKEAFYKIGEACGPKELGDLQLARLGWREWQNQVRRLEAASGDAFRQLEFLGPDER